MINKFLKTFWLNVLWLAPTILLVNYFGIGFLVKLIVFGLIAAGLGFWYRKANPWVP